MARLPIFVLVSMLVGCGDDAAPPDPDSGPGERDAGGDAASGMDAGPDAGADMDAGSDAGPVERRTYVVADLIMPVDSSSAADLGRDVDGDGTVDNQLGNVLSAFAGAAGSGSLDIQGSIDQQIGRGETILLVELLAPSFVTAPVAQGRVLRGEMPMPAPCDGDTDFVCRRHLAGTGSFVVTAPAPERAAGSIDAMRLDVGPSETTIPLTFFGPAFWVPLVAAHVRGTVSAETIASGTITGGIRAEDVDAIIVPQMHAGIAAQVAADCAGGTCAADSSGETLVGIFDADGDVMVSLDEVRMNSLIQTLLRPDVDLFDASGAPGTDGTADVLSLGLGFRAVLGSFPEP